MTGAVSEPAQDATPPVGALQQERPPGPARASTPNRWFPQLQHQRGLATSSQLRAVGWTGDALRHARDKTIAHVLPGVFAPHRGPLDAQDRLVAAYLWAGESAVLTGRVALARHGLDLSSLGECLFLVPASHRARRINAGVRTVRTNRVVRVSMYRDCVPIVGAARALCDAAVYQGLSGKDLMATTLSALQRRLTHVDLLREELAQRPRNGLAPVLAACKVFGEGAWSMPEASLATLVRADPALPEYLMNVDLLTTGDAFLGCPDGYFPGSGVASQVHSKQYHSGVDDAGRDRWSATVEKDSTFVQHGIIVVQVSPASIANRPEVVLKRLRDTVARYEGRDLSHIVVRRRS